MPRPAAHRPASRRARTGRLAPLARRGMGTGRRKASGAAVAVVAVATLLAGCASTSLSGWAAGANLSGKDAQLTSDITHLHAGIARHELEAVRTACEAFSADASTADGELPTPDKTLTDELNAAYEDFYKAGADCYESPSFSSSRFRRFESELAAGQAELRRADARYEALAGGPPPRSSSGASGASGAS